MKFKLAVCLVGIFAFLLAENPFVIAGDLDPFVGVKGTLRIAGNALQIPAGLSDSARTLTSHMALIIASDYESPEFKSIFLCGLILFVFTALIVFVLRMLGYFEILRKE
ncbi:MAG: hypothetical protein DRH50_10930 [Deltaproteobacteria bacterium]|nr:MAG: hypothetical protein DRH50_10930 [Deltaproteobacteria bacterium]